MHFGTRQINDIHNNRGKLLDLIFSSTDINCLVTDCDDLKHVKIQKDTGHTSTPNIKLEIFQPPCFMKIRQPTLKAISANSLINSSAVYKE